MPDISQDAVEALAKKRMAHRGDWLLLAPGHRKRALIGAQLDLEECAPFLEAQVLDRVREQLLSDEAIDMASAGLWSDGDLGGYKSVSAAIKAALSTLDQEQVGEDRGRS